MTSSYNLFCVRLTAKVNSKISEDGTGSVHMVTGGQCLRFTLDRQAVLVYIVTRVDEVHERVTRVARPISRLLVQGTQRVLHAALTGTGFRRHANTQVLWPCAAGSASNVNAKESVHKACRTFLRHPQRAIVSAEMR